MKGTQAQKTPPRDKGATRERILEAAEEVFAREGYYGALVDEIATQARSSKGSVYFHFPSKEELFFALIDRLTDRLAGATREAIAQAHGAVAKVDTALQVAFRTLFRYRGLARILLTAGVGMGPALDRRLLVIHGRLAHLIQEHLDAAVAEGAIPPIDTQVAAYAWLGAIHELLVQWLHTDRPEPLEESLPTVRAMLLRSIGVHPEAQTVGPG